MISPRIFLSLVLLASTSWASTVAHPVMLWKIQGTNNSIYLLGSIHMLRAEDHPLPTVIEAAYEDAEILIMEVDMDDLDAVAAQTAFVNAGVLQDDTTLQDLMGDDLYDQALDAAAVIDIPLDMLSKTEPWYAAMTIEVMALSRIGFNPAMGVEMHLLSRAMADDKPVEGLETLDEQIGFLDGLSIAAQCDMLLATLTEGARIRKMMDDMIFAWRHGDTGYLESALLESLAEHEELNRVLVTNRNQRWTKHIGTLLDDDNDYLIIVGALHLVGVDGVPSLLARKGIKMHQLSEPASVR